MKVRQAGRSVSGATLIAVAVNTEGKRAAAHAQWRVVCDQFKAKWPMLAQMMAAVEHEVLCWPLWTSQKSTASRPYPAEGRVLDRDGEEVTVCVYADRKDRLLELEFIKWADAPIEALDWNSFRVVA